MEVLVIVLSILTPICTIGSFCVARLENNRKKGRDEGAALSEMKSIKNNIADLKTELKTNFSEIKRDAKEASLKLLELAERTTRNEEAIKSAQHQINEIKAVKNRKKESSNE